MIQDTNENAKIVWSGIANGAAIDQFSHIGTTDWRRKTSRLPYLQAIPLTMRGQRSRCQIGLVIRGCDNNCLYTMVHVTRDRVTMHDIFRLSDIKKETVAAEQTFTSSLRTTSDPRQFFDQIVIFTFTCRNSWVRAVQPVTTDDIPVKQTTCSHVRIFASHKILRGITSDPTKRVAIANSYKDNCELKVSLQSIIFTLVTVTVTYMYIILFTDSWY